MISTARSLPRRTFLRGAGAAIALPFLDAMVPALSAAARAAARPVRRLGFVYVPNGVIMSRFTPPDSGSGFTFTPILQPLEPFRDRVVVISGLGSWPAEPQGDGPGDHARGAPRGSARPMPSGPKAPTCGRERPSTRSSRTRWGARRSSGRSSWPSTT